mgnify:CR=1 FL=1
MKPKIIVSSLNKAGRFVEYLWGIETNLGRCEMSLFPLFVEYLWGIETFVFVKIDLHFYPFVEYLWGIETIGLYFRGRKLYQFVEYLWGIETILPYSLLSSFLLVCRIPMRDWNFVIFIFLLLLGRVCRIPMRDWNCIKKRWEAFTLPSL